MIRLPLDPKSLYANIINDNEKGHTATVATPLLQGKEMVAKLARIYDIPENVTRMTREKLSEYLLEKSRAEARIQKVFVFDKISVNNIPVECRYSYCIYIREETGKDNVHCGRLKIHYPIKIAYCDDDVEIDNREVVSAISRQLGDFAFVVDAFEYDVKTGNLNFDVTIVGVKGVPYSKVFVNRRGTGSKFTNLDITIGDSYDKEILPLRESLGYGAVGPENYEAVRADMRATALKVARDYIVTSGGEGIFDFSENYPGALYDFSYVRNGRKRFVVVRFTASKVNYFDLSANELMFSRSFGADFSVLVVSDVAAKPRVTEFDSRRIDAMSRTINSIRFTEA